MGSPSGGWGWEVVLAHPADRESAAMTLLLRDASLATSSQYERAYGTASGPLGHVLDPRDGKPVKGWGAASAIASSATDADALSTGLFVLGPEEGARWAAQASEIAALFLIPDEATDELQIRLVGTHPGVMLAQDQENSGGAGSSDVPSNEELARRIDILSEEMEDFQQGEVAAKPEIQFGLGPAASRVYTVPRGVSVAGYGDVVLQNFNNTNESGSPSQKMDQLDALRVVAYLGYKFNDHILFNSEIEYEHASTGKQGEVSVEFAYLDFMLQREIGFRGGLVLVPVGWINEVHEPPTYLGVLRPMVEQTIIPTTWRANGVGAFGQTTSGFSYRAYVMESLRSVGDSSDGIGGYTASDGVRGGRQSGSKARVEHWGGAARADWNSRFGLVIGGSVFTGGSAQGDTLSDGSGFTGLTTIYEGHAQYRSRGIWLRGLYAGVRVEEAEKINAANGYLGASSVGSRMYGWYVDAGYDLWRLWSPGSEMSLYPYVRFERLNTQQEVPSGFLADPKNDQEIVTFGSSYYPIQQVTLKAEFQKRSNKAESGVNQVNASINYLF